MILSKCKSAFLSVAEKAAAVAAKRQKKLDVKAQKVCLVILRHKITALWEHGMCMENFAFRPKNAKKIVEYVQATYPQYANLAAAKSFVYRTIKRHKIALANDSPCYLDPMRDRRGENRLSAKRKCPTIVELCDELLSEDKATAPKVRRKLADAGINISNKTIQRIAKDLNFLWTKPWHTDVLTPAQQKKREIYCRNLLALTDEELLQKIAGWLFTDEKWWDVVGPSSAQYVKADSKLEAKMGNQVVMANLHNACNVVV